MRTCFLSLDKWESQCDTDALCSGNRSTVVVKTCFYSTTSSFYYIYKKSNESFRLPVSSILFSSFKTSLFCNLPQRSFSWSSMDSSIATSLDAGGKLSPKMFWLCFEGWSLVSHMYRRLSWVLTRVALNTAASLIRVIVIKPLGERVAWQLLWCFLFHPFCVLPLIITRQYIKAASKHSQVSPARHHL